MGQALTGSFARTYQGNVPYAGARVWGNGINPIHAQYAGPPRPFGPGVPNDLDQRTVPAMASPDIEMGPPWGAPEDPSYLDSVANEDEAVEGVIADQDDFPSWTDPTTTTRAEVQPGMAAPWGTQGIGSGLHHADAGPNFGYDGGGRPDSGMPGVPTETVSEGWLNKPKGQAADSEPADDSQVFVQTAQVQRYKSMDNGRAQLRGTDGARTTIESRVTGQKEKVYSGELRHYDMFPYQQDQIYRGFRFRTAGLGPSPYLRSNEMRLISPLSRVVPPDPSMGTPSDQLNDGGGYTSEDQGWY